MRYFTTWTIICLTFADFIYSSCKQSPSVVASTYTYVEPKYGNIQLQATNDSLHYPLSKSTYNDIESFNYFIANGASFISFFDERSATITIYEFLSQKRIDKIKLKKIMEGRSLYKPSVYIRNFDSIFITNGALLYMFNSKGEKKISIDFLTGTDKYAVFENYKPPVLSGNNLYVGVRPYVEETSLEAIRKWKLLYAFNLTNNKREMFYSLPEVYRENLYGYSFMNYTYCYNDKGNFVFCFPADTAIYETDLMGYHRSYYAKSRFQDAPIQPISKEVIENDKGYNEFRKRDSYGAIFFDPYRKRYLRLVRHRAADTDQISLNSEKIQSIMILDDNFKIIGESVITDDFSFSSIFFTVEGGMYARVNSKDENALHFVRLLYVDERHEERPLSKN